MQANQANNRLIAKNTAIVYVKLVVTMLVGLISSRFVLQALGADDFGLYDAVGSIIALFSFLQASISATTVRFMNYETGRPDGDTNKMFNACLRMHKRLSLFIFIGVGLLGVFYINNFLEVTPATPQKIEDALFVFLISTLTACIGIVNTPYMSLFMVHERFSVIAIVDIINALVKLGLIFILLGYGGNGLRFYAVCMSVATLTSFVVYHVLSRKHWPDVIRKTEVNDKEATRGLATFNNYNMLGAASITARAQVSKLLINSFFGTAVNAAFGIANQIQNYVNSLVGSLDTASAPQITQNISAGNEERSLSLVGKTCRICILLFEVVFFTLYCDLEEVMTLWLGGQNVPAGALELTRLTLLLAAVSATSAGLGQYINGKGRIKWFKIQIAVLYAVSLVGGYLAYRAGCEPGSIIMFFIAADALSRVLQLVLLRRMYGFDVARFLKDAYLRPAIVAVIMGVYLYGYSFLGLQGTWIRVGGILLTFAVTCATVAFAGLGAEDRKSIVDTLFRRAKV